MCIIVCTIACVHITTVCLAIVHITVTTVCLACRLCIIVCTIACVHLCITVCFATCHPCILVYIAIVHLHVQLCTSPLHVCTLQLCTATRGKLQCSPNLTVAHPALSLLCSLNCPHITVVIVIVTQRLPEEKVQVTFLDAMASPRSWSVSE